MDDSPAVRSVLVDVLSRHGFAVWAAGSGAQAIAIYRQKVDAIALALLDQCMPGLDGVQTMEELHRLNPQLQCCFLTGGSEDEAELLGRGADCVLHKPMEPDEVARALGELLAARQAASGTPAVAPRRR